MNTYLKNTIYVYESTDNFIPIPKEPHNTNIRRNAKSHALDMKRNPSYLEKQMQEFLDNHSIGYEFQKIFYMKSKGGFIKNYYIVDFYIPKHKVIIETDGKFHKEQADFDAFRTKDIQKHYPGVRVIRWSSADFRSYIKMKQLVGLLR